ncbi:cubilin-like [Pocillopora verrucosa]|uniref:cubilin-like n=1 Tax=Pocillopora verrucosa TaxID=203993 RepID=UPI00333FEFB0
MKKSIFIFLPLLLCFVILAYVSSQVGLVIQDDFSEADQCRQLKFTPEKAFDGKRLINHVIRVTEVTTEDFCENVCFMEPDCVCINLDKRVNGHGGYKCELNNVTHERHEHDLKNEDHYLYRAAESACVDNPCDNNSTCQSGFTDKGYRCLCITGFKGPKCKKDIDECALGTQGCSENALCNNNKGSYNCSCKPGYSGDGQTCEDIDECATGKTNCSADAVCNNTKGSYNCTCKKGYYGDGNICRLASTCKEIFDNNVSKKSGEVTLHLDSKPISVFCHMGDFGYGDGGWTPIMKINGKKRTFHFNSSFWSDKAEYNLKGGMNGFDSQETKLPSYWNTSFSKVCLGMGIGFQLKFIVFNKRASSLYSLIADGQYRQISLGRDTWRTLIGSEASLQPHCNLEGFNAMVNKWTSKARIGIIANQENHCKSCDSRIGFGTGGYPNNFNTCGNQAKHEGDNGDKHIEAMGYILVQ